MTLKLESFENRTLMTNTIYLLASVPKYNITVKGSYYKRIKYKSSCFQSMSLDDSADPLKDPQGPSRTIWELRRLLNIYKI